jgi:hypothetical protein
LRSDHSLEGGDVRRRIRVAAIGAELGFAAIPAVGYSAPVKKPPWLCSAQTPKCATLIVHLDRVGCAHRVPGEGGECKYPEELPALRVSKLGSGPRCRNKLPRCWGKALGNLYTEAHKVRVAPGRYGIAALESAEPTAEVLRRSESDEVSVRAGQTLEVTLRERLI